MDVQSSSCAASFPLLVWTALADLWKEVAPAAWNNSVSPLPPGQALLPQAPHTDPRLPSAYKGHPHCRRCTRWEFLHQEHCLYLTTWNRCDFFNFTKFGCWEKTTYLLLFILFLKTVLLWNTFHYLFASLSQPRQVVPTFVPDTGRTKKLSLSVVVILAIP